MNKAKLWALAALLIPAAAYAATTTFQTDTAKLGRPNANNKDFIFDLNAGSANPRIRANGTTSKLQFSNDGTLYSDIGSSTGGGGVGTNYLVDSNGQGYPSSAWTVTSGTGSADTSVFTDGLQSIKVTASSQQSKLSQDVTPTTDMSGQNWQATMWVKTSLTNVQVCARIATVATNCQAVSSSNTWAPYTATFIGPASGSVGIEVSMKSSGTGTFNSQLGYVGKSFSTPMLSQAQLVGSVTISGCDQNWVGQDGSTTFSTMNFNTAPTTCSYATRGSASAPSSQIPAIKFASLPPGEYTLEVTGKVGARNTTGMSFFQFNDGTNAAREIAAISAFASDQYVPGFTQSIGYTTTQSNVTLQIFAKTDGTSGARPFIDSRSPATLTISVYRMPSTQDQGYRADATPASWSGYLDATSGWSTTSGSQTDFSAGSGITLVETANRNFGTVSAAGSSLPGISFTPPRIGRYQVCTSVILNNSGANTSYFVVDGSGTLISDGYWAAPSGTPGQVSSCGIYNVASAGAVTIKVQGKVASNTGSIAAPSGFGHGLRFSILELDAPMAAPYLTGSVVSTSSGQERIERATFSNNGSVDAIVSQSGAWVSSVNRAGQGQFVVTIASGEFSAEPSCSCVPRHNAASSCRVNTGGTNNATTKSFIVTDTSGIALDSLGLEVMCMGPR